MSPLFLTGVLFAAVSAVSGQGPSLCSVANIGHMDGIPYVIDAVINQGQADGTLSLNVCRGASSPIGASVQACDYDVYPTEAFVNLDTLDHVNIFRHGRLYGSATVHAVVYCPVWAQSQAEVLVKAASQAGPHAAHRALHKFRAAKAAAAAQAAAKAQSAQGSRAAQAYQAGQNSLPKVDG